MTNQEKRMMGLARNTHIVTEIRIKLLNTGQVQVTGPLGQTKLCEEMLNESFKVVRSFKAETQAQEEGGTADILVPESRIILPS